MPKERNCLLYPAIILLVVFLFAPSGCTRKSGKSISAVTPLMAGQGESAQTAPGDLYGDISPDNYLGGKFDPQRHPLFVCINDFGIATDGRRHYLRRSTARALQIMIDAFHAEYPNIPLWVQSSTRTFEDQRQIWNNKFNGSVRVEGKDLRAALPDPYMRAVKILEFSSMPGTSRHHWGTDFDINKLTNSYYEKGDGAVLFAWLEKNAARFGFYRPYTAGRDSGYSEERWHWSYVPESVQFLRTWVELYNSGTINTETKGLFDGAEASGKLAPVYVLSVNPACR